MFECRINLALEHFINFLRLSFGGFILADVTEVLCELELTIKKVKVSTTPDGRVMDLFFITDTRFAFIISLLRLILQVVSLRLLLV